jgi:hypothetical protein
MRLHRAPVKAELFIYKYGALYRVATKPAGRTAMTQKRHTLRRLKNIAFDNKISIYA